MSFVTKGGFVSAASTINTTTARRFGMTRALGIGNATKPIRVKSIEPSVLRASTSVQSHRHALSGYRLT